MSKISVNGLKEGKKQPLDIVLIAALVCIAKYIL